MKIQETIKEQRSSPSKDKSPKKNIHKRNKSETDVSWYTGRSSELKSGIDSTIRCETVNSFIYLFQSQKKF